MSKHYPSQRYHPEHEKPRTVHSAEEDAALLGWFESPADYGVETCPGVKPDPAILEKREAYLKSKQVVPEAPEAQESQKKPRRAKA